MDSVNLNRRQFISSATAAAGGVALPAFADPAEALIQGKAEHVISIWLGGGMGQIDTFDPKRKGDPKTRKPGSYYDSIDTAVPGVQLSEHFAKLAPLMEHVTAVRTVNHTVIDEHAAATNRMHTGRTISGTVTYPSIGSIISHERGAADENAPPYVLIGYPNVTRGPGFLGPKAGYIYTTNTSQGPAGLSRADGITPGRQSRREQFLSVLQKSAQPTEESRLLNYDAAIDESLRLSGPEFNRAFEVGEEPADVRNQYGGEFGQRCLLSRRLVERGVRFIEVAPNLNFMNGAGWDVHHEGILDQHELIRELDTAVSALITDLKAKSLLDKTLIVITTEFGRPPEFDARGGRAHQGKAFSCVLAGGGLSHKGAFGVTDELAKNPVSDPVGVPDFFATICAAVGVNYRKNLYDGDRPVPITDRGNPIGSLFT